VVAVRVYVLVRRLVATAVGYIDIYPVEERFGQDSLYPTSKVREQSTQCSLAEVESR
jgi:hypothetical protein